MIRIYSAILILLLFIGCTKQVVIYDAPVNDNFELPLILNLNGKDCAYDHDTKTLKFSVHPDSLNNYSPFTKFQDYSTIKFNNKILANHSVNSFGNVELHKTYPLEIVAKGDNQIFNLIFTDIPIVQVITKGKIVNNPKIPGRILIHNPLQKQSLTELWMGIEQRGASSIKKKKKSFGITLYHSKDFDDTRFESFFGMTTNNKWILDAMYIDRSRLRNKSSFDVWRSMKPDNIAIHSKNVEVFVNSKAMGLYSFNENYTKEYLNLTNESVLYTGIDNSDESMFYEFSDDPPTGALWEEWEQKYPDPKQTIIWDHFQDFCELVADGSDQDFTNNIGQYINIDNFVDYYLFVNLCYGYDNVGKNWFFLKRDANHKYEIVLWDLDATWGRDAESQPTSSTLHVSNNLFDRLIELNPDHFVDKLVARWDELRTSAFSEANLIEVFDQNFNAVKHYQIVPFENLIWQQNLNLMDEQAYINNWINQHLVFLDNYFAEME